MGSGDIESTFEGHVSEFGPNSVKNLVHKRKNHKHLKKA